MIVDRQDGSIELTPKEVEYLTGKATPPASLLSVKVRDRRGTFTHEYKSFKDRVEHVAEEIHGETERTVMIADENCKTIARYNERGFVFDEAQEND
jgi:hypothetical protein